MNLLIAGFDNEAKEAIDKAISFNPSDGINQRVKSRIQGIISGQMKRPTFAESLG